MHWHTEEETREQDGREGTAQSSREKNSERERERTIRQSALRSPLTRSHLSAWARIEPPSLCSPVHKTQTAANSLHSPFRAVPKLLSPPACIFLSGVQTGAKEEQIDTPSGSCLALAVCGTHDGFYREKTPKHKMAEVSKFRKSQKCETAADFCCLNVRENSCDVDLDVIQVGISYYIASIAFLVFPVPSDCSSTSWYQLRPFWRFRVVVTLTHVYAALIRWLGDPDGHSPRPDGALPFPVCHTMTSQSGCQDTVSLT